MMPSGLSGVALGQLGISEPAAVAGKHPRRPEHNQGALALCFVEAVGEKHPLAELSHADCHDLLDKPARVLAVSHREFQSVPESCESE